MTQENGKNGLDAFTNPPLSGETRIYLRAEGMTEGETRLFTLSLKEAGCDVFSVRLGIPDMTEVEQVVLSIPEASRLLARRVLGSKGGVVTLNSRGGKPSLAALPLDDTGFLIHG